MIVGGVASWKDLNVPQSGVCSLRGARPDRPRHGIRAIDAARRLGRRWQLVDIGRAVRPGQSQGALRSQRHRQRRERPAATPQSSIAARLLRIGRSAGASTPGDAALCGRLAADHRPASGSSAQAAGSAAGATGGEFLHGDLPGVLAVKIAIHPERGTTAPEDGQF
jgi:hypothetical protein